MPKERPPTLVFTCEHAGAKIPKFLSSYFSHHKAVFKTHRACDFGALPIAKALAKQFGSPLFFTETSRLVVDCNRSAHHNGVISSFLDDLPEEEREELLQSLYAPYRQKVEGHIRSLVRKGHRVLHVSVHSFTPTLNDQVRNAEIGLLFDPSRSWEHKLCLHWQKILRREAPEWRTRRNYPYRGIADGFTTYLRRQFPGRSYAGIEIELNQSLVGSHLSKPHPGMVHLLKTSIAELINQEK